ncbi:hypothetical protein NVP1210O_16 [Vibrio phage 1.210.O._10N.222.52.C2]|nr:hypothetical protein NVP1210O_16 [Vibrio phage 1.210.O._10N.222.52.C2]
MAKVYLVRISEPAVSIKIINEPDEIEESISEYKSLFDGLIRIDAIGWCLWQVVLRRLAVKFKL